MSDFSAGVRAAVEAEAKAIIDSMDMMATGRTSLIGNTRRRAERILALLRPEPAPEPVARPMNTAPKDGTMLRLLVDYSGEEAAGALEDELQAWTIGFNTLRDADEDEWRFAGWNWTQDCFTEGYGQVIGWLPLHAPTCTPQTVPAAACVYREPLLRTAADQERG